MKCNKQKASSSTAEHKEFYEGERPCARPFVAPDAPTSSSCFYCVAFADPEQLLGKQLVVLHMPRKSIEREKRSSHFLCISSGSPF